MADIYAHVQIQRLFINVEKKYVKIINFDTIFYSLLAFK